MKVITKSISFLLFLTFSVNCFASSKEQSFNAKAAWEEIHGVLTEQYAYLDRPGVDVRHLFDEFERRAIATSNKREFADVIQMLLRHFYDPHLNLGPYDEHDFSVFPTGSDIRAEFINNKFVIEDVKADGAADLAGLRPGAEIIAIDDLPVRESIEKVFGRGIEQLFIEQINYGINVALGGLRNQRRTLTVKNHGKRQTFQLPASYQGITALAKGPTLISKKLQDIGYIRFNNSLGNSETVNAFQQAISALVDTKALIIDLRNTPSGGNTGVAEPILGHFVDKKTAYQRYQVRKVGESYEDAEMQTAFIHPTLPLYTKPVVVLAGRWTGSMGEGMTIGLDAIGALTVVGAPMADLLGGIKTVQLINSDTWMELGFERLYHIDGTFREDFVPHHMISPADRDAEGNDPALSLAKKLLSEYRAARE